MKLQISKIAALSMTAAVLSTCAIATSEEKQAEVLSCFDRGGADRGIGPGNADRGELPQRRGARNGGRRFLSRSEGCRQFFVRWRASNEAGPRGTFDGVGPLLNARSCVACHRRGDSAEFLVVQVSVPGKASDGGPKPHSFYGLQIQDRSVEGVPAEAQLSVSWRKIRGRYADGAGYELRAPRVGLTQLAYGPLGQGTLLSARRVPTVYDTGRLDDVLATEIESRADPDDANGDGISGRINRVPDIKGGQKSIGRFGWKAAQPTLAQQIAGAFHHDMGLSTPLIGNQNCGENQSACQAVAAGGFPEVTDIQFDALVEFSRHLRSPQRNRRPSDQEMRGRILFSEYGCASCHVLSQRAKSGGMVAVYSDLLLHDMGEGLADGRPQFDASGREWRTAPLVGLQRQMRARGGVRLLHDGRALTLDEAILWHGGEAEPAKQAFKKAGRESRRSLIAYLRSL